MVPPANRGGSNGFRTDPSEGYPKNIHNGAVDDLAICPILGICLELVGLKGVWESKRWWDKKRGGGGQEGG